jgi:hypothetical protein
VASSTCWRRYLLRYRDEADTRRTQESFRKVTKVILTFMYACLHSARCRAYNMLKSRLLQVLDLSVSRVIVGGADRAERLRRKNTRRRPLMNCLQNHAESSLSLPGQKIDYARKKKIAFLCGYRRNGIRGQHDASHVTSSSRCPSLQVA